MGRIEKIINATHYMMFWNNFIAILFHISIQLFSTKYVIANGMSHALLEDLSLAPHSPAMTSIMTLGCYFMMIVTMMLEDLSIDCFDKRVLLVVRIGCAAMIGHMLGGSYNGFILMLMAHTFFMTDNRRDWILMAVACIAIWLFARADLYGMGSTWQSVYIYIGFMTARFRQVLLLMRSFLVGSNFLLFMIIAFSMLIKEIEQLNLIEAQMEETSRVNERLEDYIVLTEQIATDQERQRIARELHDSLGHVLTGISAGIDASIVLVDHDTQRAKSQLQLVSQAVRNGIQDVRHSLHRLHPQALEELSLREALIKMARDYEAITGLDIDLYDEWELTQEDGYLSDIVFRLVQESITNSLRHGQADHVEVHLFSLDDYYIVIQDDGKGCDTIDIGYGLTHMKERIHSIGGTIEFDGQAGFRTFVAVPRNQEDVQ